MRSLSHKKQIQFGIMLHGPGGHMNAWKDPAVPPDASVNLHHYQMIAKQVSHSRLSQTVYISTKNQFRIS
jgi:hypothetical protein